jgi:hypothetical protein
VKAVKSNGSADAGHVLARAMLGHKSVGLLSGRNKLLEPGRQTIDRLFADEGAYLKGRILASVATPMRLGSCDGSFRTETAVCQA